MPDIQPARPCLLRDQQICWNPELVPERPDLRNRKAAFPGEELGDARFPAHEWRQVTTRLPLLLEHERNHALGSSSVIHRIVFVFVSLDEDRQKLQLDGMRVSVLVGITWMMGVISAGCSH